MWSRMSTMVGVWKDSFLARVALVLFSLSLAATILPCAADAQEAKWIWTTEHQKDAVPAGAVCHFRVGGGIRRGLGNRDFIHGDLAFAFADQLPLAPEHKDLLFVPASIATLLTGFLLLTTRRKAISQVIGYLVMENGIFVFGLLLTEAMPVMVEAGALLDLLVGIFVMGIVINHISREFSSIDTSRLRTLKEE